jgi:hypothetical protein
VTGGDLRRDLSWREVLGPAGVGDKMRIQLNAGGTCWALVHLHRDSSRTSYSEEDVEFAAAVAPLLAPRVRADLRVPGPRGADPAPEPGTIILAQDQSMLAATEQAWRWIDRLGIPGPNPAEPLPPRLVVDHRDSPRQHHDELVGPVSRTKQHLPGSCRPFLPTAAQQRQMRSLQRRGEVRIPHRHPIRR